MTENRIAFSLTDAEQQQIMAAFKTIADVLKPHTVVLSDDERQTLPKMSDGNLPFVKKVQTYVDTHPQFKPAYVSADDLKIDVAGYELSNQLLTVGNGITRLLEDIAILSGSEAYTSALSYYRNVQAQMRDGQPNAKTVNDDLQQRFAQQGKKTTTKTIPPTS